MSFENYTNCVFRAFLLHTKPAEVIKRKQEILAGVSDFYNFSPNTVLYVGFNPAILAASKQKIFVTDISEEACTFLKNNGVEFTYIPRDKLSQYKKQFDAVIALDEYFTFAESDKEQKDKVSDICSLAKEYVITTCKDYKNQEFKDREFSIPALIRGSEIGIYLEFHDHNLQDRNVWNTKVFEIVKEKLFISGTHARRAMFFKQLAKFSTDAGAVGFTVHKNLMYKSLIKKNYEHVISIQFDNHGS